MSGEDVKLQYLSKEWIDEVIKRVKASLTAEEMKHVSSSMVNIVENCPDGTTRHMYFRFENGLLAEALVGTSDDEVASREAEFRIIGEYDTFAKISRAELGARSALMRNKIKLKGNMVKALRLSSVVDKLNKIIATVPTDY
ncbi:MAG: SCP2 sterol-binding domain-containing protein [Candidatus Hermodarchaeota archaeon]